MYVVALCVLGCFSCKPFQRKSRRLQRDSTPLCSPLSSFFLLLWLQLVYGLWQDPPASVCACWFAACISFCVCLRECVFVCVLLSAPLSCPISAQIRASVSWGRQKYKNKAFYQSTDLNTHTHTHTLTHTHIMKADSGADRERKKVSLQQNPPKNLFVQYNCIDRQTDRLAHT